MLKNILNKVKDNKKNVIIAFLLIAILVVFCFRAIIYNLNSTSLDSDSYGKNEEHVGGIWNITEIWQTITATRENLSAFSLRFGTFSRVNEGVITVELILDPLNENRLVYKEALNASELEDNKFMRFSFNPLEDAFGKELAIRVTAEGVDTLPATLWTSSGNSYPGGALFINGQQTAQDLNLQLYYQHSFGFPEMLIIFIVALLIFAVVFTCRKKMFIFKDKIPKKYCLSAIAVFLYLTLISSVKAYVVGDTVIKYRLNLLPFLLFTAALLLTVIFEKKLRIYSYALRKIKAEAEYFKNKFSEMKSSYQVKAVFELSVRILLIASIFSLFTLVSIFFILNLLSKSSIVAVFILASASALLLLIKLILIDNKPDIPKIFLILVIIFTLFLSYGLPPSTDYIWDAEIHFSRIMDFKTMLFGKNDTLYELQTEFKQIYAPIKQSTLIKKDSLINLFEYVGYFPSAIMIAISDALSMNLIPTLSLAKYSNALLFALLIYKGLKRLKSGKLLFSAIALIPCNMFLASGFSYDFWVTAFLTYAFALFVSELQNPERKISSETVFLMLSAAFIGCGPKMIYFAMAFPFLFLSKGKFENSRAHKTYVVATSLTMFAVFASFALPFFTDVGAIADVRGGANVNSGEQLAFILKNPLRYARILFNFILQYVSLGNMSLNLVNYAYYGFSSLIYGTVGTLLIVFTALTDKEDDIYQDKKKHTVVTLFTALAQVALVATALYIAYTPVMHSTVNGCQYRYMFPILTPIFYFVGSSKIKNVISKKMSILIVFALSSLAMLGSLYDVYISKILALM